VHSAAAAAVVQNYYYCLLVVDVGVENCDVAVVAGVAVVGVALELLVALLQDCCVYLHCQRLALLDVVVVAVHYY